MNNHCPIPAQASRKNLCGLVIAAIRQLLSMMMMTNSGMVNLIKFMT